MNNILTQKNIDKLQEELDYRFSVRRVEIAKDKLTAAAHGDRSENAEYKEACAEYRENDNRIQYLMTMINTAIIVEDNSADKSTLKINSKARVLFDGADEDTLTLVTTVDSDPENMCVSIESALGLALEGKKLGDIVTLDAPGGSYTVEILEILE